MPRKQKTAYVISQIEDALLDLLQNQSFHDISISQITSQAQVSRNSFYRNFKSKEAIVSDCIYRKIRHWQDDFNQRNSGGGTLIAMWQDLFDYLRQDRDFYRLLEKQGLTYLLGAAIEDLLQEEGERPNSYHFFLSFMMSGIFGWIKSWIQLGMPDEESQAVISYLRQFVSLDL